MKHGYAVFFGDVALDEYYSADRWPGIKDKVMVDTLPAVPGGMIANAAAVYASYGAPTYFGALLNGGAVTQVLLKDLNDCGVDTSLVVFDDALPDSKCIIVLAEGEHTIFIPKLEFESVELGASQLELLAGADFIYSTPNEMSHLRCGEMGAEAIIDHCRARGAKLVYDIDVDYLRESNGDYFKRLDIAFFNEMGFESFKRGRADADALAWLFEAGVAVVVITLAENGCTVYTPQQEIKVPGIRVENVVDVTGAGDTFCSSFMYAFSRGKDLDYAARFANSAASIAIGTLGARAGAVGEPRVLGVMEAQYGV